MTILQCTHRGERNWVDTSYEDDDGNYYSDGHWEEESLQVDIDLHRFMCTRCKKIGYYSSRAENFFKGGIGSLPEHDR